MSPPTARRKSPRSCAPRTRSGAASPATPGSSRSRLFQQLAKPVVLAEDVARERLDRLLEPVSENAPFHRAEAAHVDQLDADCAGLVIGAQVDLRGQAPGDAELAVTRLEFHFQI